MKFVWLCVVLSSLAALICASNFTKAQQAQSPEVSWWRNLYPTYSSEQLGNVLKISYDLPYLRFLRAGKRVKGGIPEYKAKDEIVDLDFKFNNTTPENIFATSVDFKVVKSQLINETIPVVSDGQWWAVSVSNLGWEPMRKLKVSYTIKEEKECETDSPMPNRLKEIAFDAEHPYMDLTLQIGRGDIPSDWDVANDHNYACALGELDYVSSGKPERVQFGTTVQLGGAQLGAEVAPTGDYDLSLTAGRDGYVESLPISDLICANSPDRFMVHFQSDRSASFDLDIDVRFTDGTNVAAGNLELNYFRPPHVGPEMPHIRIQSPEGRSPPHGPSRLCPG
jgi:hypothetical protein